MTNDFRFTTYIPDILEHIPEEIEDRLLEAAIDIHREVTQSMGGERAGEQYKVPGTSRMHRASRPFETPAVMLGNLLQTYRFELRGRGWDAAGVVGSPLDYAEHLEYGTRKMAARPHLRKAAYKVFQNIDGYFEGIE